jgi:hypothetical protein
MASIQETLPIEFSGLTGAVISGKAAMDASVFMSSSFRAVFISWRSSSFNMGHFLEYGLKLGFYNFYW